MFNKRLLSSELQKNINKQVEIAGWLYKKRELGKMTFLVIRDRSGLIQVLVEEDMEKEKLKNLQNGSVLIIKGLVAEEKRATLGVEIHNPKIQVIVPVKDAPPIEIDKAIDHTPNNLETLLDNRIANMRNVIEQNIFKIQTGVGDAIREYLKTQEFIEFHSPKLLAEATEGGAEVFKLDYFGRQASLAQSAQFYKQIMVGAYERAFEFGATYRAEPSMTTRHMSEFITVDAEMGFINGLDDILDLISEMLNFTAKKIWQTHKRELESLKAKEPALTKSLPKIAMKKLHELYFKETGDDTRNEKDPTPKEERFICEYSAKNWQSEAVFITEFPSCEMKFYHLKSEKNPEVAERADLLFRGVEVITTSLREYRYEKLVEQLKKINGDPSHPGFKYYLQCFKYGMPPHGGFGLGLERLTQKIIGLQSVKEATIFPRDINRLSP